MRILVLGGEGMLGHKMFQLLGQRFGDVHCTIYGAKTEPLYSRTGLYGGGAVLERVDASKLEALRELLDGLRPDVVVNCIGIVKQRPEAHEYIPSIMLNSLLPHFIAATCLPWGGRLIHFSTDCVFTGNDGGYTEESPSDAEDLYGKSKFLGETPNTGNALTLRTSIIGRELFNFQSLLEWFLAQNHGTIRGYSRVLYSGVTTNQMARVVGDVIERFPGLSGLCQVTSTTISKHDLLRELREAFGLDMEIIPEDETLSDRSMIGAKFQAATGFICPSWPDLCADLANDPTPYADWRASR